MRDLAATELILILNVALTTSALLCWEEESRNSQISGSVMDKDISKGTETWLEETGVDLEGVGSAKRKLVESGWEPSDRQNGGN